MAPADPPTSPKRRGILACEGRLFTEGRPAALESQPEIRRAYLAVLEKKGITPDMSYALAANDD